jgi:methionine-rich copper-binding protein CopC
MTVRSGDAGGRALGAVLALVTAALVAVLPAVPAEAHDTLVSSSPASGSTVTAVPRSVTLTFDEPVLDYAGTTALVVTGPDGAARHFETACARVSGRTVSAAVALGGSGRYVVSWRVVSADGHPVSDSFPFTLHRPTGTTAAAGSARGPSCGTASTSRAGAAPASSQSTVSPLVWALVGVGAGLVVVLLVVVLVVALRLSRRPAGDDDEGGPGAA